MEEIIKDLERFWSETMRTFKEVVEKGAREVLYLPAREPGLPLPDVPYSEREESHDRCK